MDPTPLGEVIRKMLEEQEERTYQEAKRAAERRLNPKGFAAIDLDDEEHWPKNENGWDDASIGHAVVVRNRKAKGYQIKWVGPDRPTDLIWDEDDRNGFYTSRVAAANDCRYINKKYTKWTENRRSSFGEIDL